MEPRKFMNGHHVDPKMVLHIVVVIFQTILVAFGYEIRTIVKQHEEDLVDIKIRLSNIESNRFTVRDGLAIWRELDKKANLADVPPTSEVRRRLNALEADAHPPPSEGR